jgi:hypothetical protein
VSAAPPPPDPQTGPEEATSAIRDALGCLAIVAGVVCVWALIYLAAQWEPEPAERDNPTEPYETEWGR